MHPGFRPTRAVHRHVAAFAALSLTLVCLGGCNQDGYDPELKYPVRTDWLVAQGTWEIQPTKFNLPGHLPMDHLRETLKLPEKDVSPDQLALRSWVDKKLFDPQKLSADLRGEYGKQMEAIFGTPAQTKVSGLSADGP